MLFDDENIPLHAPKKPRDLSTMSVQELDDYITALRLETARAEDARAKKQSYKSNLDQFFTTSKGSLD